MAVDELEHRLHGQVALTGDPWGLEPGVGHRDVGIDPRPCAGHGVHRDLGVFGEAVPDWRRTGHEGRGIATEAVHTMTRLSFDELRAQRVELRIDNLNSPSWRVAERCGFTLEGVMRSESLAPDGTMRDMRVYSKVRGAEEPPLQREVP